MAGPHTEDWERDPARVKAEHQERLNALHGGPVPPVTRWDTGYQPDGYGNVPELLVGLDGSVLARFTAADFQTDMWHVLHSGPALLKASDNQCAPNTVCPGEMLFTSPGMPSWRQPTGFGPWTS